MTRFDTFYRGLMNACGIIAGGLIGILTALVCYDVIGRNIGFGSVPWIVEVAEYMLPVGTCFAAPWLMHQNQHVRLDLLDMALSPATLARVDRAVSGLAVGVCAIVTWYSIAAIVDSRAAGTLMMKALVFPEWWLLTPLPIGFFLLGVECLRRMLAGAGAGTDPADGGPRRGAEAS